VRHNVSINSDEYFSFLFFDKLPHGVSDHDILGEEDMVREWFQAVQSCVGRQPGLKYQVLFNNLDRIRMMIELLENQGTLSMTKFVCRNWKLYSRFSLTGEIFVSLRLFKDCIPDLTYDETQLILNKPTPLE